MFKECFDIGREDMLEGVFYLSAIKLIGGLGFMHKLLLSGAPVMGSRLSAPATLCGFGV